MILLISPDQNNILLYPFLAFLLWAAVGKMASSIMSGRGKKYSLWLDGFFWLAISHISYATDMAMGYTRF